jgi:DCN1-like protein 1/2
LITIEGTMEWCTELGIDPSSVCSLRVREPSTLADETQDSVLFCLATDLGSKATGEWEKEPFVQGWAAMPGK